MAAEKKKSKTVGPEERADWLAVRGYGPDGEPASDELARERLIGACAVGDGAAVGRLLAKGLSASAAVMAEALKVAFEAGHGGIAIELAEAVGWGSKFGGSKAGGPADRPAPWATQEGASPEALSNVAEQAGVMLLYFARGAKWAWLSRARDLCDPAVSDARLVGMAFEARNLRLALDASRAGARPSARTWRESIEGFVTGPLACASVCDGPADRHSLFEWLSEPANVEPADPKAIRLLFASAMQRGDPGLLAALLDAGLRPGADWCVDVQRWDYAVRQHVAVARPIVWMAAKVADPGMFKLALACGPAVEAAKGMRESPESMAEVMVNRVLEIHAAGIPVDGVDSSGGGLGHAWAAADHEPRQGWSTLMRKLPAVFELRDAAGRSGAEAMAAKLKEAPRRKFLADLAKWEGREIKAATGKAPAEASPKRRL